MKKEESDGSKNIPDLKTFGEQLKYDQEFKKRMAGDYTISKRLLYDTINDRTKIKDIEPIIKIMDSNFAVKGDFSIVGGLPKVGKTTICAFMIATAFMEVVPDNFDSLGIRTKFCKGKPVVYFDTEQPSAYTNKLRVQIKKMLGLKFQPDNLHIINLRKYNSVDKAKIVFAWMNEVPDAHLWIVDGVADLVQDPNNTEQAFQIIEKFMMMTDKLHTSVVLHLHENPGGGKLRGNLGSEAERKCGGAITLRKKDGIHSIEPKVIRGSEDFENIYFKWDKLKGGFATLDEIETKILNYKSDPENMKKELREKMANRITLNGGNTLEYAEAWRRIKEHSLDIERKQIEERTAKARLKEMVEMGLLVKNDMGLYLLSKE